MKLPDKSRKLTSDGSQKDGYMDETYSGFAGDEFYLYEVACAIADGDIDEMLLGWVKDGFAILCS